MIRRLAVGLAIVAALAALADRALATYAGVAVGRAVQRSENLDEPAEVTFRGFPFVTQALRGRFRQVEVRVRDMRREDVTISRIDADLRDVRVGLGDALAGEVEAVPVGSGAATVAITYADLDEYLRTRAGEPQVRPAGNDRIEVRADVGVPGRGSVRVVGTGTLALGDAALVARLTDLRLADGGALPAAARAEALRRVSVTIPLRGLPFGIRLTSVEASPEAIEVTAAARGIVIRAN